MTDSRHHSEYDELLALHALDALDGEDRRAVEAHLAGCAPCRQRFEEHLGTAAALAGAAEPVEPPAGARQALLRRAAAESGEERRDADVGRHPGGRPATGTTPPPAPAARAPDGRSRGELLLRIAAVLLLAVTTWSLWSQLALHREVEQARDHNRALLSRLRQSEEELLQARDRLASTSAALATVAAGPETVLAGLGTTQAQGRLYSGHDGVLLVVEGLPRPPEDRTYQLWGIVDGTPVSAGLFSTDADGDGFLWTDVVPAGSVELWAVTEEPAGGVPQPTGDMVLRG